MEKLLNKLIGLGWKPYGQEVKGIKAFHSIHFIVRWLIEFELEGYASAHVSLKELLTDKNSGLWQFVCENKLTTLQIEYNNRKPPERGIRYHWNKHSNVMQEDERLTKERKRNENYEYRLIESSLTDESELESFILENIKIDEN